MGVACSFIILRSKVLLVIGIEIHGSEVRSLRRALGNQFIKFGLKKNLINFLIMRYLCFLVMFILINDCSSNTDSLGENNQGIIYLGGIDQNNLPVVYKGNQRLQIENQGLVNVAISHIHKNGSNLYLTDGIRIFWKNGILFNANEYCANATNSTNFQKITFNKDDIYISALENYDGSFFNTIKIWKNGELYYQKLRPKLQHLPTLSIDSNGKIYYSVRYHISSSGSWGNVTSVNGVDIIQIDNNNEYLIWQKSMTSTTNGLNRSNTHYSPFDIKFDNSNIYLLNITRWV